MALDLRLSLTPAQAAIHNSPARFKVVAAGRRFGKSYYAACALAIEALKDVNDRGYKLTAEYSCYYVAPTMEQAKRLIWPKLREILGYEKTGGFIANENTNDGWIELINGHRIYIRGADNPESLRGISPAFIVMDEYADMKPELWESIIELSLMDVEAGALFIGTPKGKNHFYKLFMGALEKPNDSWDDWEAFHFSSTDNPFLKEKELKRMRNNENKPLEVIKQEMDASFISGGSRVLKASNFPIIKRQSSAANSPEIDTQAFASKLGGNLFITVDLAGFAVQTGKKALKSDETVICTTMVCEDVWYVLDMQHGHWDVRETSARIVLEARKHSGCRLGIEAGALARACGPYLEEYMRTYSRYITPEGLQHGNTNKVDRIVWALQGRSERGRIQLLEGDWNPWFLDQASDFPDYLSHDDGLDALAYVDQMSVAVFDQNTSIDYGFDVNLETDSTH